MSFSFDRKYLLALTIALLLFVVLVDLGANSIGRLRESMATVEHTHQVQAQIDNVEETLLKLETSQRGYLLTLDGRQLDSYKAALVKLGVEMATLVDIVSKSHVQSADIKALQSLIDAKRAKLARTLELADAKGVDAALEAAKTGTGEALMDKILAIFLRIEKAEARELAKEKEAASDSINSSIRLAALLGIAAAGLLGWIYLMMRAEMGMRRRAELAEAKAMSQLERRIDERTKELSQALQALHLSEAQLRGIFDSAHDAILTADEAQTVVLANPAAAKMFRCSLDKLIGAPLAQLLAEPYRVQYRQDVNVLGTTGDSARHMDNQPDAMGIRADGEAFPIDAAISHFGDGDKKLYTVILRDVTVQRLAQTALRESESRLRRLLMLLPEPIFVVNDARINFINEAAQQLFGADEASLLGRSPFDLIHPDSLDAAHSLLNSLNRLAIAAPLIELKVLRADGAVHHVESTAALVEIRGETPVLVVLRDITELRQTKIELARSYAELQRLFVAHADIQENERKRIAREIHDDLQQRLAAIKIGVAAISKQLANDPARAALMLATVDELATAAIASTRRIVFDLRPQILDDFGLIPALQELVDQISQRTGIDCDFQAQSDASESALESPELATCLYRVTQEALNNVARHAQATAVSIRLETASNGSVELRVSDNGKGISPDDRRKSRSFGLLGMHERVRALGGVLVVTGQPGAGATVQVQIPKQPSSGQA